MTNNDMKKIKFDMLIEDIDKTTNRFAEAGMSDAELTDIKIKSCEKLRNIYDETTLLCIFFDTKTGNDYRTAIFSNTFLIDDADGSNGLYSNIFTKKTFSDDTAKKLYLTKKLIELYRQYPPGAVVFVFWALFAACVDKTDYDEKISMIADFAHMVNIDEDTLFDITQVIKIIFGKDPYNISFKTEDISDSYLPNVLDLFKNNH